MRDLDQEEQLSQIQTEELLDKMMKKEQQDTNEVFSSPEPSSPWRLGIRLGVNGHWIKLHKMTKKNIIFRICEPPKEGEER